MGKYIMLTNLTEEGRRTIKMRPERIKEVNRELEEMGVTIEAQYAALGPYDFVNILDAPDNETIARVVIELGARGTVQIETLSAIPVAEFEETMTDG